MKETRRFCAVSKTWEEGWVGAKGGQGRGLVVLWEGEVGEWSRRGRRRGEGSHALDERDAAVLRRAQDLREWDGGSEGGLVRTGEGGWVSLARRE